MILGGFVDSGVISYHTKLDNNRKPIGFLLCCCCVAGLDAAGGAVERWSCRLLQVPPPSADWQCAARRAVQSAQLGTDRFYRAAAAQTRTLSCDAGPALPTSPHPTGLCCLTSSTRQQNSGLSHQSWLAVPPGSSSPFRSIKRAFQGQR